MDGENHTVNGGVGDLFLVDLYQDHSDAREVRHLHAEVLAMLGESGHAVHILTDLAAFQGSLQGILRRDAPQEGPRSALCLLWCGGGDRDSWKIFLRTLEEASSENPTFFYQALVIFGDTAEIRASVSEVMQHGALAFACPFNVSVLRAYIQVEETSLSRRMQMRTFKNRLEACTDLDDVIGIVLQQLEHPIVGYSRATVTLMDQRDNNTARYLYQYRPHFPIPDRTLIKPTSEDSLMSRVADSEKGVHILENLQTLRQRYYVVESRLHQILERLQQCLPFASQAIVDLHTAAVERLDSTMQQSGVPPHLARTPGAYVGQAFPQFEGEARLKGEARLIGIGALESAVATLHEALVAEPQSVADLDVLDELTKLRGEFFSLREALWEDNAATQDVNSWVGIALWAGDECIGHITLDHVEPDYYGRYGERLSDTLADIGSLAAEIIEAQMRRRHTQTINSVVKIVTNCQDSSRLARGILTMLEDVLKCDSCAYYRVTQDYSADARRSAHSDSLVLEMWEHSSEHPETSRMWGSGQGIAGHALRERQSIIVPHALEDRRFMPTAGLPGGNLSMLVVPVLRQIDGESIAQVAGVISCYKVGKADHFTPYDRILVEEIAKQTLAVIERTEIIESSHEIGKTINDLGTFHESVVRERSDWRIFEDICKHAVKITGASTGVIHRLEENSGEGGAARALISSAHRSDTPNRRYALKHSYSFPAKYDHKAPRLEGDGATNHVISAKGRAVQFSHEEKELFQKLSPGLRAEGVQFVVGVGLFVTHEEGNKQAVGVLFLNQFSQQRFSPIAMFMLELFAQQAALAIRNQQLFKERDLWAQANRELSEAIAAISRLSEPGPMYDEIVARSGMLVEAEHAYLALVAEDNPATLKFEAGWPERNVSRLEIWDKRINFKDDSLKGVVGLAAAKKEPIIVDNIEEEQHAQTEIGRHYFDLGKGTVSELAVPIVDGSDQRLLGVINLESRQPAHFTAVRTHILLHVARHVSIAWQKNELLQKIHASNNEMHRLLETLERLATYASANTGSASLLQKITDEIERSLPCMAATIVLVDADRTITTVASSKRAFTKLEKLDNTSRDIIENMRFATVTTDPWTAAGQVPASDPQITEAICLPLRGIDRCIGVLWLHFSADTPARARSTTYQAIANQMALLYEIVRQRDQYRATLEQQQAEIAKQLNEHYDYTRREVGRYSIASLLVTAVVFVFLVASALQALTGDLSHYGLLATFVALFAEFTNLYIYRNLKRADAQREVVHKELFLVRSLDVLLVSADQLEKAAREAIKGEVIRSMSQHVFDNTEHRD